MVNDILMTDLIAMLILFYIIIRPPVRCLSHLVGAYMTPRPGDQCLQIDDRFFLISSHRGMGPLGSQPLPLAAEK